MAKYEYPATVYEPSKMNRFTEYESAYSFNLNDLLAFYEKWRDKYPALSYSDIEVSCNRDESVNMYFDLSVPNINYDEEMKLYLEYKTKMEEFYRLAREAEKTREAAQLAAQKAKQEKFDLERDSILRRKLAAIAKRAAEDPLFNVDMAIKSLSKKFQIKL